MSTQEKIMGNWNQFKGKVKQRWGQLTDDELSEVEGNFDQLVGLVQQKTGEARQQIERTLNDLSNQAGGTFTDATEAARQYVDQASEKLRGACRPDSRAGQRRLRAGTCDGTSTAGRVGSGCVRGRTRCWSYRGDSRQLARLAASEDAISNDNRTYLTEGI